MAKEYRIFRLSTEFEVTIHIDALSFGLFIGISKDEFAVFIGLLIISISICYIRGD